jgi:energy-coupling factor transport system permease protein
MLAGLGLRFFPVLEEELAAILQAQAARGLELGSTTRRVLRLVPILLPFCLRSIRRAGDVALAMELRGFGFSPTRTFVRTIRFGRADAVVCCLLAALLIAYLLVRLLIGI